MEDGVRVGLVPVSVKKYKRRKNMKFLLMFDGTLMVAFEPHEITEQIEFLASIEPTNEEDSEMLQSILFKVVDNSKKTLAS